MMAQLTDSRKCNAYVIYVVTFGFSKKTEAGGFPGKKIFASEPLVKRNVPVVYRYADFCENFILRKSLELISLYDFLSLI